MQDDKQTIRKEILAVRMGMSSAECEQKSLVICDRLLASELYKKANTIYAYMAFRNEVDLSKVIMQCLLDHKSIALPKISGSVMTFHCPQRTLKDDIITRQGYFGIEEPAEGAEPAPKPDLILLPGVAFDKQHNRIGYGKGFYDTYISQNVDSALTVTVGIAYECQLVDTIPAKAHDYRLHHLLTECAFY